MPFGLSARQISLRLRRLWRRRAAEAAREARLLGALGALVHAVELLLEELSGEREPHLLRGLAALARTVEMLLEVLEEEGRTQDAQSSR